MQLQLWPKPCIYISHETETSGSALVSGDSDLTSWKAIIIYTDIARIDTTIVDDDKNSSLWLVWGRYNEPKNTCNRYLAHLSNNRPYFIHFLSKAAFTDALCVSWHKLTNYPAGKPWFWGRSLSQVIKHVLAHLHWQRTGFIQGHCIGLTGAQVSESKKSLSASWLCG